MVKASSGRRAAKVFLAFHLLGTEQKGMVMILDLRPDIYLQSTERRYEGVVFIVPPGMGRPHGTGYSTPYSVDITLEEK